ncbi:hypothetical protein MMPV_005703 [Pyropia vietnamensis]
MAALFVSTPAGKVAGYHATPALSRTPTPTPAPARHTHGTRRACRRRRGRHPDAVPPLVAAATGLHAATGAGLGGRGTLASIATSEGTLHFAVRGGVLYTVACRAGREGHGGTDGVGDGEGGGGGGDGGGGGGGTDWGGGPTAAAAASAAAASAAAAAAVATAVTDAASAVVGSLLSARLADVTSTHPGVDVGALLRREAGDAPAGAWGVPRPLAAAIDAAAASPLAGVGGGAGERLRSLPSPAAPGCRAGLAASLGAAIRRWGGLWVTGAGVWAMPPSVAVPRGGVAGGDGGGINVSTSDSRVGDGGGGGGGGGVTAFVDAEPPVPSVVVAWGMDPRDGGVLGGLASDPTPPTGAAAGYDPPPNVSPPRHRSAGGTAAVAGRLDGWWARRYLPSSAYTRAVVARPGWVTLLNGTRLRVVVVTTDRGGAAAAAAEAVLAGWVAALAGGAGGGELVAALVRPLRPSDVAGGRVGGLTGFGYWRRDAGRLVVASAPAGGAGGHGGCSGSEGGAWWHRHALRGWSLLRAGVGTGVVLRNLPGGGTVVVAGRHRGGSVGGGGDGTPWALNGRGADGGGGGGGGPDEVLLLALAPGWAAASAAGAVGRAPPDVAPIVECVWAWVGRVGGGLLVEGALAEIGGGEEGGGGRVSQIPSASLCTCNCLCVGSVMKKTGIGKSARAVPAHPRRAAPASTAHRYRGAPLTVLSSTVTLPVTFFSNLFSLTFCSFRVCPVDAASSHRQSPPATSSQFPPSLARAGARPTGRGQEGADGGRGDEGGGKGGGGCARAPHGRQAGGLHGSPADARDHSRGGYRRRTQWPRRSARETRDQPPTASPGSPQA